MVWMDEFSYISIVVFPLPYLKFQRLVVINVDGGNVEYSYGDVEFPWTRAMNGMVCVLLVGEMLSVFANTKDVIIITAVVAIVNIVLRLVIPPISCQ